MEKIQNLKKIIQDHRQQNTGTNELINQIFNEINNLIEEIYPFMFTQKEILLEDLNYILENKHKMFSNGSFIDHFSRDLYNFESFLVAISLDYRLKTFIENHGEINPTLKCYEAIGKLFNFYLYFFSCEKHYIHRSDIEKILKLLENYEILLIEKFDINFKVERKSKYNIDGKITEYLINMDELQVSIHMSGDIAGFIYMELLDHSPIFRFLDSIKQKINTGINQHIKDLFWRPTRDKTSTLIFSDLSHSDLLDFIIKKLGDLNLRNIHNFRDEASIDLMLNEKEWKIGIQIEGNNDIRESTKKYTFVKSLKAQIEDARRIHDLDKYVILLCIDLNIKSYETKLRMAISQLEQINDDFFTYITPENLVGFFSD